jgi:Spy/CpxP family protein refolding chaperone
MAVIHRVGVGALLAALLVTSAPVASAADDPFGDRLLPVELVMAFRKQIDLTAEQNKRLGDLVVELQSAVAGKQWEMQSAYFELIDVLDQPTIDETRATALAKRAIDIENEIKVEQLRLLIRMRNLLSSEQIVYLRARLADGWKKPS